MIARSLKGAGRWARGIVIPLAMSWSFAGAQAVETRSLHDDAGQLLAQIFPLRSGQPAPQAERHTYLKGLLVRTERGTLSGTDISNPPAWGSRFTVSDTVDREYDAQGQLVLLKSRTSGGFATAEQYSYDSAGRRECTATRMDPATFAALPDSACKPATTSPAHAADRITKNSYDTLGRLSSVRRGIGTPEEADQVKYSYTRANAIETVTDANGNVAKYEYDVFGRRTSWWFPDSAKKGDVSTTDRISYRRDAADNLTGLTLRDGGTIAYEYDALNRMSRKRLNGKGRDVAYGHNNAGQVVSARFPTGATESVELEIDGFGDTRSERVVRAERSYVSTYRYDPYGNLKEIVYPHGTVVRHQVDPTGQVTGVDVGGSSLAQVAYDSQGRRLRLALNGKASIGYRYGADDELAQLALRAASPSGGTDVDHVFQRNQARQITAIQGTNEVFIHSADPISETYGVNGLNQYTGTSRAGIDWTTNGELARYGNTNYSYDAEGKLISVQAPSTHAIGYDPLGRLTSVSGPNGATEFLYVADEVAVEMQAGTVVAQYVHGPYGREPIASISGSGSGVSGLYLADERGSIVLTTDAGGWPRAVATYGTYGARRSYGPEARFGYGGQLQFSDLGLVYAQARFFHPALGRFMQIDPAEYASDFNLYAYAVNDPMNKADPTGLAGEGGCVAGSSTDCTEKVVKLETVVTNGKSTPPPSPKTYVQGFIDGAVDFGIERGYPQTSAILGGLGSGLNELFIPDSAGDFALAMIPGGKPLKAGFKVLKKFNVDDMAKAAQAADKGGMTRAGRALDKHSAGQRPGSSPFPPLKGNVAEKNAAGQHHVEDLLTHPDATFTPLGRGGMEVKVPDGRAMRYDADGRFAGFI